MANFPVWLKVASDGTTTLSTQMRDGTVLTRKDAEAHIDTLKRTQNRHMWELVPTQRSFYQVRGYLK